MIAGAGSAVRAGGGRDPGKRAKQSPAADADGEKDRERRAARAPHVLIVRTPDGWLTFLQALGSRRKGSVGGGIPANFTGYLMTDGYTGYQHLLDRIVDIQQCCQHIIRRAHAVMKLGPAACRTGPGTSSRSWARHTGLSRKPHPQQHRLRPAGPR
jgi:Transposase IS66 family